MDATAGPSGNTVTTKKDNNKRKSDVLSPPISETQKRYTWDPNPNVLLQNNKYYPLSTMQTDKVEDQQQISEKPSKIPPIFLHNVVNYQEILKDIKTKVTKEFSTKYTNNKLKINLNDIDDYRKLTKFYTEEGLEFHSFQDPNSKHISVIIRHLPISLTEEEISNELLTHKLPIIRVTRLLNKDKRPIPICAVQLKPDESAKGIYNIKSIFQCIVDVEARRKPGNIPQCHRCQEFGHTRNYCFKQPKCVKCGKEHITKNCTKVKTDPPTCANCGGNHPANYRGCMVHQNIQQRNAPRRRPQGITQTTKVTPQSSNSYQTTTRSYSQILKQPNIQHQNINTSPISGSNHHPLSSTLTTTITNTIIKFLKDLFTPIISQIKEFITCSLLPNLING